MASGRLIDYLGADLIANRDATPVLHTNTLGLFYATDTGELSAWDGSAWIENVGGPGIDRTTASALATSGSVDIDYALGDYFTLWPCLAQSPRSRSPTCPVLVRAPR